jgi:hypothetical protein
VGLSDCAGKIEKTPAPHHACGVLATSVVSPVVGSMRMMSPDASKAKMSFCDPAKPQVEE